MKTLKFASEIYWPLGMSCEQLATIILTRVIWHLTKQRIIIKVHFFQISCKDREASFYHPESRLILGLFEWDLHFLLLPFKVLCLAHFIFGNFVFSYFGQFSCVIFFNLVSVLNFCLAHLALLSKKSKQMLIRNILVPS